MKKILVFFLLINTYLFSANYSSFKTALKKEKYDKAISIYAEVLNSDQNIKYKDYIYRHIVKLMNKDIEKAEYLLKLYLDVEYENHVGLFLYAQIHIMNENYHDALEVLYKLKGYNLQKDLAKKVAMVFDTTVTNYLDQLYTNTNISSLKQLIDFFITYDDKNSIKKTKHTLIKIQDDYMEKAKYTQALNILYWLLHSSHDEESQTNIINKINFNISKIIDIYYQQKDTKQLEILSDLVLNNNDTTNQKKIDNAITKLNEKNNLAKLYNKTIPLTKKGDHFIMQVSVNGIPLKLMIDTGATYSSINQNILNNLSYRVVKEELLLYTFNGTIKEKLISVDEFSVDDITLHNFNFVTSRLNNPNDDGVIGMNFFKKFDFKIDQEENLLYLSGR